MEVQCLAVSYRGAVQWPPQAQPLLPPTQPQLFHVLLPQSWPALGPSAWQLCDVHMRTFRHISNYYMISFAAYWQHESAISFVRFGQVLGRLNQILATCICKYGCIIQPAHVSNVCRTFASLLHLSSPAPVGSPSPYLQTYLTPSSFHDLPRKKNTTHKKKKTNTPRKRKTIFTRPRASGVTTRPATSLTIFPTRGTQCM